MSYTYNPEKIVNPGKDRMRFELGDVMVEGGVETCALTDEEYNAILSKYKSETQWKKAKLEILKSIVFRFSYEVDTKVGPLSLSLSERSKHWKTMCDELKKELENAAIPTGNPQALSGQHYFSAGMHDNKAYAGSRGGGQNVR